MEENEGKNPSLPANYITIVDLQKRWLEQQQQKKQLKEDVQKKMEELNVTDKRSINNGDLKGVSDFQKFNSSKSYGNPNFGNRKFFRKDFKVKETREIGCGGNEVEEGKVDVKKSKLKKKKRRNKMIKGDNDRKEVKDDEEKRKVIEDDQTAAMDDQGKRQGIEVEDDDQTVEIEPKLKEVSESRTKWSSRSRRSTAAINGRKTVYLGHRRVEDDDQTTEKDNQGKRQVIEVEVDDQTVEIEPKLKEISGSRTKWSSRRSKAAINGTKTVYLGHRRVEDDDQTTAKEDQGKRQVIEVEDDDQTVEIEPKLKEISGNKTRWRSRRSTAAINETKTVYLGHRNVHVEQENETLKLKSMVEQQALNQSTGGEREVREVRKRWEVKREKEKEKEKFTSNQQWRSRRSREAGVGPRRSRNLVWVKRTELNLE